MPMGLWQVKSTNSFSSPLAQNIALKISVFATWLLTKGLPRQRPPSCTESTIFINLSSYCVWGRLGCLNHQDRVPFSRRPIRKQQRLTVWFHHNLGHVPERAGAPKDYLRCRPMVSNQSPWVWTLPALCLWWHALMNTHTCCLWILPPNNRCVSLPHPQVFPWIMRLHGRCPSGPLIVGPLKITTTSCPSPCVFLTRLYTRRASLTIWISI